MEYEDMGEQLMKILFQFKKIRIHEKEQNGLHPSEIHTLFMIHRMNKDTPGQVMVSDISRAQMVSVPTITQKITSLEASGYVHRQRSNEDRRKVCLSLTEKSETLLHRFHEQLRTDCIELANHLGLERSRLLNKMLIETFNFFSEKYPRSN